MVAVCAGAGGGGRGEKGEATGAPSAKAGGTGGPVGAAGTTVGGIWESIRGVVAGITLRLMQRFIHRFYTIELHSN